MIYESIQQMSTVKGTFNCLRPDRSLTTYESNGKEQKTHVLVNNSKEIPIQKYLHCNLTFSSFIFIISHILEEQ